MIYKPDDISAMRIINVPRRAIGIDSVNNISGWANKHGLSFVNALYQIEEVDTISDSTKKKVKAFLEDIKYLKTIIDKNGMGSAIPTIVQELKYIEYLETTETEIEERKENIDEFLITLALKSRSDTTIKTYQRILNDYFPCYRYK